MSTVKNLIKKISVSRYLRSRGHYFEGLKTGDVAIDCGANIGDVTAKMAAGGATVYAFEPHPEAFAHLARRFKNDSRVTCVPKGVWDHEDKIKLYLHQNDQADPVKWSVGASILAYKSNVNSANYREVEVVDLASVVRGLGHVKLIKLDVEGAEYDILQRLIASGAINEIEMVLVETHHHKVPELIPSAEKLMATINQAHIKNIHLDWW